MLVLALNGTGNIKKKVIVIKTRKVNLKLPYIGIKT
jgi:hypothetical protein